MLLMHKSRKKSTISWSWEEILSTPKDYSAITHRKHCHSEQKPLLFAGNRHEMGAEKENMLKNTWLKLLQCDTNCYKLLQRVMTCYNVIKRAITC